MTDKPNLTRVWAGTAPGGNVVDPDTVTAGKFAAGWQAEVPPFEYFNFIQKQITEGLAHINEQGIAVWDDVTTYPVGALAKGSDGNVYKALTSQSDNDPVSDSGTNWVDELNNRVIRVTSIAAMEAYSAPVGYVFSLNAGGRSGVFDVVAGDFSTELSADTENGRYIGQADDPTALVKVAKRRDKVDIIADWYGADTTDASVNASAFQAAIDNNGSLVVPNGPYNFEGPIVFTGVQLFGRGLDSRMNYSGTNAAETFVTVNAAGGDNDTIRDLKILAAAPCAIVLEINASAYTLENLRIRGNATVSDALVSLNDCFIGNIIGLRTWSDDQLAPTIGLKFGTSTFGVFITGGELANYGDCIEVNDARHLTINTILEGANSGADGEGLKINDGSGIYVSSYFEKKSFYLAGGRQTSFENCTFTVAPTGFVNGAVGVTRFKNCNWESSFQATDIFMIVEVGSVYIAQDCAVFGNQHITSYPDAVITADRVGQNQFPDAFLTDGPMGFKSSSATGGTISVGSNVQTGTRSISLNADGSGDDLKGNLELHANNLEGHKLHIGTWLRTDLGSNASLTIGITGSGVTNIRSSTANSDALDTGTGKWTYYSCSADIGVGSTIFLNIDAINPSGAGRIYIDRIGVWKEDVQRNIPAKITNDEGYGQWVPRVEDRNGNEVTSYSIQTGEFTRANDFITATFKVTVDDVTGPDANDRIYIKGLPIDAARTTRCPNMAYDGLDTSSKGLSGISAQMFDGTNRNLILKRLNNGDESDDLTDLMQNGFTIEGNITYPVAPI